MDASSSSVSLVWNKRYQPLGKVKQRVQDVRVPSSSSRDRVSSSPSLDLSHNESARLAADSLLSRGLEGYHQVLKAEGEVDFLSRPEKNYIMENMWGGSTGSDPDASDDDVDDKELESSGSQSATQRPGLSTDSDPNVACLDPSSLGPKGANTNGHKIAIYFQSDSKPAGMKDIVREFIRTATVALAIVMDSFSDVELLCDLLEASKKRGVAVHLLLDHHNLDLFVNMWQDLGLSGKTFPKLSVRSVSGQTYCAKTGRKMTGQIAENFIITDWTEVLTGSYSFSWLSWQVHRSLAVLFKGSTVTHFQQEFQRLYCSSKPVAGFVTHITDPHSLPTVHEVKNPNTDASRLKSSQTRTTGHSDLNGDAQTKDNMALLPNPQSNELECNRENTQSLNAAGTGSPMHEKAPPPCPEPVVQPGFLQSVPVEKPKHTEGDVCTQHETQTNCEPLDPHANQIQSPSNPLSQTNSHTTTVAENNVSDQETKLLNDASPTQGQPSTVRYQSTVKTNSNLGLWFPSAGPRGQTPGPQVNMSSQGTWRQDQPQRPPSRFNVMPQSNGARPRPVVRQSSLSAAYGQKSAHMDWGAFHNNMALIRSKSMTERHTVGYNPNKTRI